MPEGEPKLILASSSPQRMHLLAEGRYTFEIMAPSDGAECGVCSKETPGELVARLARQKATDVHDRWLAEHAAERVHPEPRPIILACDTVAECVGQVLGKPRDREHARQMLEWLSEREHRVYSGLCLWPVDAPQPLVRVARTTLRMVPLTPEAIEQYLATGLWEGKAGAFGYQDRVGWLQLVEGSESNVIGLPMELLAEMLREIRFSPPPSA